MFIRFSHSKVIGMYMFVFFSMFLIPIYLHAVVSPSNTASEKSSVNKIIEMGRSEWKRGELEKALLTLDKAVNLDHSNKQTVKILKSMQLQKERIDGLLNKASAFIAQKNYSDAKKSLEKVSYMNQNYPRYKKIFQQLLDHEVQKDPKKNLKNFILRSFYDFDHIYDRWQNEKQISPQIWLKLAQDKFTKIEKLANAEKYDKETLALLLRSKLLLAECYLFASVDFFLKGNKTSALRYQNEGIILLEKLLNEYDPENDYLPSWSNDLNIKYAGYDQVGTGLRVEKHISSGGLDNKIIVDFETTGVRNSTNYKPIAQHQKRVAGIIKNNRVINKVMSDFAGKVRLADTSTIQKQENTSNAASRLLNEFCPWGVEFYQFLYKSGLAKGLDLKILKPYGGLDWKLANLIDELGLESIVPYGGEIFKNNTVYPRNPPNMSQFNISKEKIPMHISDEMKLIRGNGKYGFLDPFHKEKVQWDWIEHEPTYTITFFSPRLIDMSLPGEKLKTAFDLYNFISGGALAYIKGNIVDKPLEELLSQVKKYYGATGKVYFTSSLLVKNRGNVNITSDILIKDKYPDPLSFLQKMASSVFATLDSEILNGMYEGLDPRKFSLGKSYDGSSIPSIMIRANTLGFQKVPIDEYTRTLEITRFYSPLPSFLAGKKFKTYDLREKENWKLARSVKYLEEQSRFKNDTMTGTILATKGRSIDNMEDVRKWVWKERTEPFLRNIRINDMSPWAQTITIKLPEKNVIDWQQQLGKNKALHVQLHAISKKNTYNKPLINDSFNKSKLTLIIYNTHHTKGKSLGSQSMMNVARSHGKKDDISYGVSDARYKEINSNLLELLDYRLPTQYFVKITEGKNGQVLSEFPLVLKKERGNPKVNITGKLSSTKAAVELYYEAKEQKLFDCIPPKVWANENKNMCICPPPLVMNKIGECVTCSEIYPKSVSSSESKTSWHRRTLNAKRYNCHPSKSSECKQWVQSIYSSGSFESCVCSDGTAWRSDLKMCGPVCRGPADGIPGAWIQDSNGCYNIPRQRKKKIPFKDVQVKDGKGIFKSSSYGTTPGFNWSKPVPSKE